MESSTADLSSRSGRRDRPFDDYAFLNLSTTGEIDNLSALLDAEERYLLSESNCNDYRSELDTAAGAENQKSDTSGSCSNDWRYRIARWMLRASDELNISRETASIAMSYYDRFLLGKTLSRALAQRAAITSLLVASKLFEKRPIKMATLMKYTQDKFHRCEILSMETELITSMGSFLYPPTPGTFVLMFLAKFSFTNESLEKIIETSQFIIELANCDFFFVPHRQSNIAVAAIALTLEQLNLSVSLQCCLAKIKSFIVNSNDADVKACLEHLRTIYTANEIRINEMDKNNMKTTRERSERKRVCRAATPSPTPDDEQNQIVIQSTNSCSGEVQREENDGGQRKRQRYDV